MRIKVFIYGCLGILFISFLAVGCSDVFDTNVLPCKGKKMEIGGDISQEYVTRANDSGFADGDRMGVFVVDYDNNGQPGTLTLEGNRANNIAFTYHYSNDSWSGAYDIYWKDDHTAVDVYGYYPYNSAFIDVNTCRFEISADQSLQAKDGEMGNYEASDFLWAKEEKVSPDVPVIRLKYQHLMAGLSVQLEEGTGFSSGEWAELARQVLICNLSRVASVNIATGQVSAVGEADKHIIMANSGDGYRAVVVPQTATATKPLFCIRIGGIDYFFERDAALQLQGGKLHKFTIQINKRAESGDYDLKLLSEDIAPWENDEVSHRFDVSAYVVVNCPKAGTLKASIEAVGENFTTLKNLKVTGELTTEDFDFMRDKMTALTALNLKEVKLKQCKISEENIGVEDIHEVNKKEICMDNVLPDNAFKKKRSLSRFVFPENLERIGRRCFSEMTLAGNIVIPEGVTHIGDWAFDGNLSVGELILPNSLEYIGVCTFYGNCFSGELRLPAGLKHIGCSAFLSSNTRLTGDFQFPENLIYLGVDAFGGQSGALSCEELIIPQGINIIRSGTMGYNIQAKRLVLHDGITEIGDYAFENRNISGELYLPNSIRIIGRNAFREGQYSGTLKLPDKLLYLGPTAFEGCSHLTGDLVLPNSLEMIESATFWGCCSIERLYIPENVSYIGERAFANCFGLTTITCMAKEPPALGTDVFAYIDKSKIEVMVPEESVEAYRHADGWKEFTNYNAHYELETESNAAEIKTLNKGTTRSIILKAGEAWSVESMPDWCTLSATSGKNKKTELTLTVQPLAKGSGNRKGEIVFKLDANDYRFRYSVSQYDAETEGTEIRLQTATKGKGVKLFLLGDGFDAQDIAEGRYVEAMRQQMENFFDIEPYRTYRDYFTVYTAIVESPNRGIGSVVTKRDTHFGTSYDNFNDIFTNYDAVRRFVVEHGSEITNSNLPETQIVLVTNSNDYGGHTEIWSDGNALSICPLSTEEAPYDARGIIQHEAGGHGFAKLGDEGITHYDFITGCCCPKCQAYPKFMDAKSHGWYQNLSLSNKMKDLPWAHLIFDSRFSARVDIYEGGYNHARAVYRSEASSIMGNYQPYFNTISRETIVRRIMQLAGEPFEFEQFAAKDLQTVSSAAVTRSTAGGKMRLSYGNRHREPHFNK